jgi:glycosyltransferase involved in cell wall biosynthesis
MPPPQISVIIPVYNRGPLIEKTVVSALNQDVAPETVEILLVDDGSSRETAQILDELAAKHPQIRVFHLPNGGVARARNFGLEQARGEFTAFLDHDDLWLPEKLRLQLEIMRQNPDVGVVYCDWLAVDEAGAPMPLILQHSQQSWWHPRRGNAYPWILMPHPRQFLRNPILSMSFPLIKTALLRRIGGFDARTVPSDDWDLWIRLARITQFDWVPQVLVHYVHHDAQQHNDQRRALRSWLAICRKHRVSARHYPYLWLKMRWFERLSRALLLHAEAEIALENGDRADVVKLALRAGFWRPDTLIYHRWRRLLRRALALNRR